MSFPVGSAVVVLIGQGQERAWHAARVVDLFTGGLRASLDGTTFTVPVELHNVMPRPDAAMARRDWAVRVLDAWAEYHGCATGFEVRRKRNSSGQLTFRASYGGYSPGGLGSSREAARLAAAEAVWPELPESVRAEIGERP